MLWFMTKLVSMTYDISEAYRCGPARPGVRSVRHIGWQAGGHRNVVVKDSSKASKGSILYQSRLAVPVESAGTVTMLSILYLDQMHRHVRMSQVFRLPR